MFDGLLQTKLFVPTIRTNLVIRAQLIDKFNEGQQGKLMLVSAPAGYGKTSLVTTCMDQLKGQTAVYWLSLDEDDSDPRLFFSYLAAALQPLLDEQATLSRLLQSPQTPPVKQLIIALINDLTAVRMPFSLVLDDYHAIESSEVCNRRVIPQKVSAPKP